MITFTRIKTVMRDGWSVNIPTINTLHDGSLAALVKYTADLGYLKSGDTYKVVNHYTRREQIYTYV